LADGNWQQSANSNWQVAPKPITNSRWQLAIGSRRLAIGNWQNQKPRTKNQEPKSKNQKPKRKQQETITATVTSLMA
jgi:hypothetical protein